MSDDEHMNGQMETNENSDSNENSVSFFFSSRFIIQVYRCKKGKRKFFHTFMFGAVRCVVSIAWCLVRSIVVVVVIFCSSHDNRVQCIHSASQDSLSPSLALC